MQNDQKGKFILCMLRYEGDLPPTSRPLALEMKLEAGCRSGGWPSYYNATTVCIAGIKLSSMTIEWLARRQVAGGLDRGSEGLTDGRAPIRERQDVLASACCSYLHSTIADQIKQVDRQERSTAPLPTPHRPGQAARHRCNASHGTTRPPVE